MVTKQDRLGYTARAQQMVDRLNLEEKVSLMSGNTSFETMMQHLNGGGHYNQEPYPAGGLESENLPPMLFCDGPRGVVCNMDKSTCYPVSMCRGASFDPDLEERIGHAIGREVRAYGGNTFAGVCINLPYNPGWGRSQETYGEESFHLGEMGAALMRGVQEENVMACVKHFAFNQMELARFDVNVVCDVRTEREVYLPHFKKCVDQGAASIMSSYNKYKTVHCGHNDYLLNQVLKKEWDFDGYVMSDFIWGVKDTVESANGGQDMEMCITQFFGDKLVDAVNQGQVPVEKIDQACLRIIRTILAVEDAYDKNYGEEVLGCPEHIALARESARKGITLMQNNGVLPLSKDSAKTVLLVGKLAATANTGDHGSSWVFPPYVSTPLTGMQAIAPDATILHTDGTDLEETKALASKADAVLFVVGYNFNDEGEYIAQEDDANYISNADGETTALAEGGDRVHGLSLHQADIDLIKAVAPCNKQSIVALIGGNTIMIEEWKDDVSAILMTYYSGMEGGTALAEIIFGDVNPSGKLPYVQPVNELDLPQVDWHATEQVYEYYHGYTRLEKRGIAPSLPYGFGLSYTTFALSAPTFAVQDGNLVASCQIANTGAVLGDEVVQLYVGFKNSEVDRPVKILRGFSRVSLDVAEQKSVTISCPLDDLRYYNPETACFELEAMDYEVYIGTSSANADLMQGVVTIG